MKLADQTRLFAEHDAEYRAKGLATIPVGKNKEPLGKGWNALDVGDAEILGRRQKHPDANIGALAGTAINSVGGMASSTKFAFADVDNDLAFEFVKAVLVPFISGKFGSKGGTIFVQAEEGLKSTKIFRKGSKTPVLEIFITSGMTVLPPSTHPSGARYRWLGAALLEIELGQLPRINEVRVGILLAVLQSEDAWFIMEGGAEVQAHNAMLSLTSCGIANLTDDLEWLAGCLGALFHREYRGNTKEEILGMLRTAKAKGLGASPKVRSDYAPGEWGPKPLGFTKDGLYALLDPQRQIIIPCSAGQLLSEQFLVGLAPSWFWMEQFPSKKGFNSSWAGEALIEACRRKGPFDPLRVRGRGIWREGNRVVVNLGGPVESDKHLYLCFTPIDLEENATFDASRLLKLLQMFNWRNPQDAMLLLGWLAIAPICGVLRWRPHCFVYGPARSGKTTIHSIAATLLWPLVIAADGQSTEAGIRQTLGPDSLPVILDEFESDQNSAGLRNVLRLARSSSSAETPILKGTPEGKAMTFSLRAAFLFAAINPRGMSPADQSRILMFELLMHDNDSEKARHILQEEGHLRNFGSSWCSYMVSLANLIVPAIDILEPVIPSGDRRHRQNLSTLLGAAFIALNRRVPTLEEAQAFAEEFRPAAEKHAEDIERDDALECFEHLLAHVVEGDTLGYWLAEEYKSLTIAKKNTVAAERYVAMYDIRVVVDGEHPGVLIRNGSAAIERVFQGTVWAGRAWQRALRKLSGSFLPPNPIQFSGSGMKARCVGIPLSYLPDADLRRGAADY
ncbi:MAG: bifunctional DNA primase/polymerase [Rhizobiales bacterium]|nr:bifunctional DNA primase/polymerase [Hyphomicrobiales bacterium]